MRPIRLTMQAFGPYAKREVIDFRSALSVGLFGIYGPTGSGKSTIFSAMTFALFGEAVKNEQDINTFRSDHAENELQTEVEFIFEIGLNRYLVRRRPDQLRPKRRGEGQTKLAHEAWLFDVTGMDVDEISAENCGKVVEEKKVGLVKTAIIERLGFGADQFKQVILLPQGKFEAFLTAKTDQRLKILRDLFDVSLYQRLASKLKEDSKSAEDSVRRDREVCAGRLKTEGFESPDALRLGIDTSKLTLNDLKTIEADLQQKSKATANKFAESVQIDHKFVEFERAVSELDGLEKQADALQVLVGKIKKAKVAKSLVDLEQAASGADREVEQAMEKQAATRNQLEGAVSNAKHAAQNLERERSRSDELTDLSRSVEKYGTYKRTLSEAEKLGGAADDLETKLIDAKTSYEAADATKRGLIDRQVIAKENLAKARKSKELNSELSQQLSKAEQELSSTVDYEKALNLIKDAKQQVSNAKQRLSEARSECEEAKEEYKTAEAELSAVQALHLAEKLVGGEPCPVCGSDKHPSPATGSPENKGLDSAFRVARDNLERARQAQAEAEGNAKSSSSVLAERSQKLDALVSPEKSSTDLIEVVSSLKLKIKELAGDTDIQVLEKEYESLSAQITLEEGNVEKRRSILESASIAHALARQSLDNALSNVPVDLRDADKIEAALSEMQNKIEERNKALLDATNNEQSTREAQIRTEKDLQATSDALDLARKRQEDANRRFDERLTSYDLSRDDLQIHKSDIEHIEDYEAEVTSHSEKLAIAKNSVASAKESIEGKERPDLNALRSESENAEQAANQAAAESVKQQSRVEALERLFQSISDELERIDAVVAETASLRELADAFNARNEARIDLESFAIGAMFDQVLQAANARLGPMSGGRYTLEREMESGKGAARRGLDICVYDINTGRTRPTSTLSGGETFIAALALALGLSDVVESISGSIHLDTIFIDEGFGSLDAENDAGTLDQVLQTLNDLVGQRRAVGLVSHVQLVQQTIPNGFWIDKGTAGSKIEHLEYTH